MAPEHHAILSRLLNKGQSVRLWLDVQNRFTPGPAETANVFGEIRGTALPEDVVLLGAHLDSWDLGQGATDDAFGVAAVLGAAEAILKSGFRPRRTVRFAFFTGEEQGLRGSQAYVKDHTAELGNHVAAVMADAGDGPPIGLFLNGREDLIPLIRQASSSFSSGVRLRVTSSPFLVGDSLSFTLAGIPAIDLQQNSEDSKYTRHSAVDTFDKVKPENLVHSASVLATLAFWIADRPERLAAPLSSDQTEALLTKLKLNDLLKVLDLKPSPRR